MKDEIKRLKRIDSEIQYLAHTRMILEWDQETYMPEKAIGERSEQIALLESIIHNKSTTPEIGEILGKCGIKDEKAEIPDSLNIFDRAFLREFTRQYFRRIKLPSRLVVEIARQTSLAQASWVTARKKSDFKLFAANLKTLISLTREKAECLGYVKSNYEPLLDEFEPYAKPEEIDVIFSKLKTGLKDILSGIISSKKSIKKDFLARNFALTKQQQFGEFILKKMGFDFSRGRLDISAHPFTTTLGCDDIRLTTRYNKNLFPTGLFGIIHECGHGLYELGFGKEIRGTLLAQGTSLGIHESQSRLWENIVGRSFAFWKAFFPKLQKLFPECLSAADIKTFVHAINAVSSSHIRVEADEVTYNLHIILRYNLERELFTGNLSVSDLPGAWNAASKELLGIQPPDDAHGVLQDIHWSIGAFGYFPTYTLGNLYSAQFYNSMKKDIPELDEHISKGELDYVLSWLRANIHTHGGVYTAGELCKNVTGKTLDSHYFLSYLFNKYKEIYEF